MGFTPRRFPVYYLPPGCERPSHLFAPAGVPLLPGAGPDGQGGIVYHGIWSAADPHWQKAGPGWWVNLNGATPEHLLRTVPLPGIIIQGALPGHRWLIPVLLQPDGSVPEWLVVRGYDASGTPAWVPMEGLADLIERLRALRLGQLGNDEVETLAIDLLARNHHISEHELLLGGWLLKPMLLVICRAALGVSPETAAHLGFTS